jgi:predicted Ser/Thr protein kinase
MSLTELEKEVQNLSPEELRAFVQWMEEYTAKQWDEQFARDVTAGKLEQAGRKADTAFDAGRCTEL